MRSATCSAVSTARVVEVEHAEDDRLVRHLPSTAGSIRGCALSTEICFTEHPFSSVRNL